MPRMISSVAARVKQLVVPEGVMLLAIVALLRSEGLRSSITDLGRLFAFAVFVGGALLAWRFHRGRVVLALAVLAVVTVAMERIAGLDLSVGTSAAVVFHVLALLLPLNFLGITLLGERGVLTRAGMLRVGFVALQALAIALLAYPEPSAAAGWFSYQLVPAPIAAWTPLAQPALLAYAGAGIWLGTHLFLRPSGPARGFLWALGASFLALHVSRDQGLATVYLGSAGLILGVGVIEATYFMAYRDHLTDLPARRAFNEALLELGSDYSIAMIDVDRFKKFNDQNGHQVGDQVLKMVARQLADVSGGGKAYRYGGEEFAIVFPGKRRDDCVAHLEQLRQAVEEKTFTVRGRTRPRTKPATPRKTPRRQKQLSVTVSIGVAERSVRHPTPEKVVRAADLAMYRAKKAGRNRIRR